MESSRPAEFTRSPAGVPKACVRFCKFSDHKSHRKNLLGKFSLEKWDLSESVLAHLLSFAVIESVFFAVFEVLQFTMWSVRLGFCFKVSKFEALSLWHLRICSDSESFWTRRMPPVSARCPRRSATSVLCPRWTVWVSNRFETLKPLLNAFRIFWFASSVSKLLWKCKCQSANLVAWFCRPTSRRPDRQAV